MSTIARFTLVQLDAADGAHPSVIPWATGGVEQPGLSTAHRLLGVTMTTSEYGEPIAVMKRGILRDVAEQNSETWAVGDLLWAAVDGSITKTRPAAPIPFVSIGYVYDGPDGSDLFVIAVDVRVMPSLGELSGVSVETPADKDVFIYNSGTAVWEPRQIEHNTDVIGGRRWSWLTGD